MRVRPTRRFKPSNLDLIFSIFLILIPFISIMVHIIVLTPSSNLVIAERIVSTNSDSSHHEIIENSTPIKIMNRTIRKNVKETLNGFIKGFQPAKNQNNSTIKYFIQNEKVRVAFGESQIIFIAFSKSQAASKIQDSMKFNKLLDQHTEKYDYSLARLKFIGSNTVTPIPCKSTGVEYNYFIGNNSQNWGIFELPQEIIYKNIYPNIDLYYSINDNGNLKYEFFIYPGGNINDIQLQWEGTVLITSNGDDISISILTSTNNLIFTDSAPVYFQSEDRKVPIPGEFLFKDKKTYGFKKPHIYDQTKILIVDPVISMLYSTFLGGSIDEDGKAIAIDSDENIYVGGYTASPDFPTVNAYNDTFGGGMSLSVDCFVFKMSSDGSTLLFATFIGGNDREEIENIKLDQENNVYITGYTYSSNFPTTENAYNRSYGGSMEIFISKLSAKGNSLIFSTYLGDGGFESGEGLALDSENNVYIGGYTSSIPFPTTQDAYDPEYNGGFFDAFITKFSSNGSKILYSTFIGGNGTDTDLGIYPMELIIDIYLDSSGQLYATGGSEAPDFPTVNAFDSTGDTNITMMDVIALKLSADGKSLLFSTYISGTDCDIGTSIAVDKDGNVFITGYTESLDFPTENAISVSGDGDVELKDVFVSKLASTGSSLIYSTYISGSNDDEPHSIAIDTIGNAYICGETYSTDFPCKNAYNTSSDGYPNRVDVFVAKLNNTGNGFIYSSYITGTYTDYANDLVLNSKNDLYITGMSSSSDFPTTQNSYNQTITGTADVIICKISTSPTFKLLSPANKSSCPLDTSANIQIIGSNGTVWYKWNSESNTSFSLSENEITISLPGTDGIHILTIYAKSDDEQWSSATFEFTIDSIPPQIVLNGVTNCSSLPAGTPIPLIITGSNGSYSYQWNDQGLQKALLSEFPILPSEEATHHLNVIAFDETGNSNSKHYVFTSYNNPPLIKLINTTDGAFHQSKTTIYINITGANGSYIYHWDNNANLTVDISINPILPSSEGLHTLLIYAANYQGKWASKSFTFTTDDTPPEIILISPSNGSTVSIDDSINISITGTSGVFYYHWDNGTKQNIAIGETIPIPPESGTHILYIFVKDAAGNEATAVYEFTVSIDSSTDLIIPLLLLGGTTIIGSGLVLGLLLRKGIIKLPIKPKNNKSSKTESSVDSVGISTSTEIDSAQSNHESEGTSLTELPSDSSEEIR